MTFPVANLRGFDMAISIPARDLSACVDQGLNGLSHFYPQASLPTANWVLGARAEELGIAPVGQQSANASCQLLRCADGWLALNLARDSDWQLLGAWLQTDTALGDWGTLQMALNQQSGQLLQARGREMGLALAFVDGPGLVEVSSLRLDHQCTTDPQTTAARSLAGARVVDLSALWAGPLCAHLLHACGAAVTVVSSTQRPDGARQGSPLLYDQLHAGHEHLVLDFEDAQQCQQLALLLTNADVVIEASRPRALLGLGLNREALAVTRPQIWLGITAYGRAEPAGHWVGFGDDVAAAAQLLQWDELYQPSFVGDAVADPLTGTFAALAVADALARGRSGRLDLSMHSVAAACRYKIQQAGQALACPIAGDHDLRRQ